MTEFHTACPGIPRPKPLTLSFFLPILITAYLLDSCNWRPNAWFSNYRLFLWLVQSVNVFTRASTSCHLTNKDPNSFQTPACTSIETRLIESGMINQIQHATGWTSTDHSDTTTPRARRNNRLVICKNKKISQDIVSFSCSALNEDSKPRRRREALEERAESMQTDTARRE